MDTPEPSRIALEIVTMAGDERFDEIAEMFAQPLQAQLSPSAIETAWATATKRRGRVRKVTLPQTEPGGDGLVNVTVTVEFARREVRFAMAVDETGLLHSFRLDPFDT